MISWLLDLSYFSLSFKYYYVYVNNNNDETLFDLQDIWEYGCKIENKINSKIIIFIYNKTKKKQKLHIIKETTVV